MILLLSDDLLDASKTIGHARPAAITIRQCKSVAVMIEQMSTQPIACCIVDLQCSGFNLSTLMDVVNRQQPRPRVIAYGSHMDAERLKIAREAGCDEVMPRSKYFVTLPSRIAAWAAEGERGT